MSGRRILNLTFVILFFAVVNISFAQNEASKKEDKDKPRVTTVIKELQGELSGIGHNSLSITYQRDTEKGIEYDMLFYLDKKNIKLQHKKSLSEINLGDMVNVSYDEVNEETDGGIKTKRIAKEVSFIRAAPKKVEQDVAELGTLAIKGMKE
jgi:hypothetical protein